jgi:hypothetical protein
MRVASWARGATRRGLPPARRQQPFPRSIPYGGENEAFALART